MPVLTSVRDLDDGPTNRELAAIDAEMPIVTAEMELLGVEISLLDEPATLWSERLLRRAHRDVLTARLAAVVKTAAGVA